ncbi:Nn.00g095590.m01.CDS01 [Neocucurbitaria sp. VM-36]
MNKRIFPHNNSKGGVSECPAFRKPRKLRREDTTSEHTPKETCFFWYHGNCRRGEHCGFAHETHITWPITIPLAFVHYEACTLPLCPLREDLVALKNACETRKKTNYLGGQVAGALSSRATTMELVSSSDGSNIGTNTSSKTTANDKVVEHMAIEYGAALPGGGIAPSKSGSNLPKLKSRGNHSNKAVAAMENLGSASAGSHAYKLPTVLPLSPTSITMDYLDVSKAASPPPSSEYGDDVILSLSHTGTLGKRGCQLQQPSSPSEQTSNSKYTKREATPDLSEYVSILERKRSMTHWDLKSPVYNLAITPEPEPMANHANSSHDLRVIPTLVSSSLFAANPHSESFKFLPRSLDPPKDPRASSDVIPICFHWYHKGHCRPKRHNGRAIRCSYTHSLDVSHLQVSLPPNITDHGSCQLDLCPLRLQGQGASQWDEHGPAKEKMESYNRVLNLDHEPVMVEPHTPVKYEPAFPEEDYNSSPRNAISLARYEAGVKGPKFNKFSKKSNSKQLPKLTGVARERFKEQQRRIEHWQRDNGITLNDPETSRENLWATKKHRRQAKRQKRQERLSATTSVMQAEHDLEQVARKPLVLVDYELPEGEARLDWDTDPVRRLFAEIE